MVIAGLIIWETRHGLGPFFSAQSPNTSLLLVDIFLSVLTTMGLLLVGALTERKSRKSFISRIKCATRKKGTGKDARVV